MAPVLEPELSEAMRPLRRSEYQRLVEAGVFERERVELVRGVVVAMAPIGPDHNDVVEILNELLMPALAGRARLRVQSSFAAPEDSQPEPDLLVLDRGTPRFQHRHPEQALLVIEVAESSLRFDLKVKAALYAEAGVPEYWVFDVAHRQVLLHDQPADGHYARVTVHRPPEVLHPAAFPEVAVPLASVFPQG